VNDDGEAVVGDRQLDELHRHLRARFGLDRPDRPRCIGDIDFIAAELGDAAPRAGDPDRDAGSGPRLLELFGDGFGHRIDGAGAVNGDHGR
jgi:hypothetical protein